jgi:hypothetical protein
MSQYFDPNFVASEDMSPFQEDSEFPLPSPSSTGFPLETLLDTPAPRIVRPDGLPSPLDTPGPSRSQPQTTAVPVEDDVRNHDGWYEGVTEAESWGTGGTHAPIVVPTTPLVRFTQSVS